jgi:hypothetical protein
VKSSVAQRQVIQLVHIQLHHAVHHLDAEARRAAFIWRAGAAVRQTYRPVVQRARHGIAQNKALTEWAAFVRTAVKQGKHLVFLRAKHGHSGGVVTRHAAGAEGRNVFNAANRFPNWHDLTQLILIIGRIRFLTVFNCFLKALSHFDNAFSRRKLLRHGAANVLNSLPDFLANFIMRIVGILYFHGAIYLQLEWP